jgi:integrase/recombinase XerC
MNNRTHPPGMALDLERCMRSGEISETAIRRVEPTLHRAVGFFEHRSVGSLADVQPDDARDFVRSRLESGLPASVAVLHNRRSALRLLFRVARRLGLAESDPTLDLLLPPKSSAAARPLDDDEIELCRDVAQWASAQAAIAWALAETTARGAEIAAITSDDIDLGAGTVEIKGNPRTMARVGTVSEWGLETLRQRTQIGGNGSLAYAGEGRGIAGQVSTCRAISSVLVRAGLAGEPDVRPMSVAGWAGRRVLDETGSIESAARAMGVRSLDRAARLVGHDWTA